MPDKKYILVIVDAFTKYVKLYAMKTMVSREIMKALSDYFINYNKPLIIVSARGTGFMSQEFEKFLEERNVKHILVATGSPQSNGQVERGNRVLAPILGKLANNDEAKHWYQLLPDVEYALNNSVSKSTGETPITIWYKSTRMCERSDKGLLRYKCKLRIPRSGNITSKMIRKNNCFARIQ